MALPNLAASIRPCISSPIASEWIFATCRRHQSSFRRTRKGLKVKPDPSFLPTKTEKQDHIIFNPPSSLPNVYHTPSKFLPSSDPRRIAADKAAAQAKQAADLAESRSTPTQVAKAKAKVLESPGPTSTANNKVPRNVVKPHTKTYNVTKEQVEEIRKLRAEDPVYWTRVRLAKKFDCSSFFINLCAKSASAGARQQEQLEAIKAKWGRVRTIAREAKYERQKLWGRD